MLNIPFWEINIDQVSCLPDASVMQGASILYQITGQP